MTDIFLTFVLLSLELELELEPDGSAAFPLEDNILLLLLLYTFVKLLWA